MKFRSSSFFKEDRKTYVKRVDANNDRLWQEMNPKVTNRGRDLTLELLYSLKYKTSDVQGIKGLVMDRVNVLLT